MVPAFKVSTSVIASPKVALSVTEKVAAVVVESMFDPTDVKEFA